jgi:hypothetical protein
MKVIAVYKNWQGRVRRLEISEVRDLEALRTTLQRLLDTNVVLERPRR